MLVEPDLAGMTVNIFIGFDAAVKELPLPRKNTMNRHQNLIDPPAFMK